MDGGIDKGKLRGLSAGQTGACFDDREGAIVELVCASTCMIERGGCCVEGLGRYHM